MDQSVTMARLWRLCVCTAVMVASVRAAGIPHFLEFESCASLSLMDSFQTDKFLGQWYAIKQVTTSFTSLTQCVVSNYTAYADGNDIYVTTTGLTSEGIPGSSEGDLLFVNDTGKPYFQAASDFVPSTPYHIIATDYTSYSCIYSCLSILGARVEMLWVLSRTPRLHTQGLNACTNAFTSAGVDMGKMDTVTQDCYEILDEEISATTSRESIITSGSPDRSTTSTEPTKIPEEKDVTVTESHARPDGESNRFENPDPLSGTFDQLLEEVEGGLWAFGGQGKAAPRFLTSLLAAMFVLLFAFVLSTS